MIKKYFIFDLDDTLIDSGSFNQQMFIETFLPYLKHLNSDQERQLRSIHYSSRGKSMLDQFRAGLDLLQLNLDPIKLVRQNEYLHTKKANKIKVFNGVTDYIKYLNAVDKRIAICSNRQTKSISLILSRNSLDNRFDKVISCADSGYEKPDPHCLLDLVKTSGLSKDEFVYFGDSSTDAQFAGNAGIDYLVIDQYLNKGNFFKLAGEIFNFPP